MSDSWLDDMIAVGAYMCAPSYGKPAEVPLREYIQLRTQALQSRQGLPETTTDEEELKRLRTQRRGNLNDIQDYKKPLGTVNHRREQQDREAFYAINREVRAAMVKFDPSAVVGAKLAEKTKKKRR